jgi:hypothetical protein
LGLVAARCGSAPGTGGAAPAAGTSTGAVVVVGAVVCAFWQAFRRTKPVTKLAAKQGFILAMSPLPSDAGGGNQDVHQYELTRHTHRPHNLFAGPATYDRRAHEFTPHPAVQKQTTKEYKLLAGKARMDAIEICQDLADPSRTSKSSACELRECVGRDLRRIDEQVGAAPELIGYGIAEVLVVSLGHRERTWPQPTAMNLSRRTTSRSATRSAPATVWLHPLRSASCGASTCARRCASAWQPALLLSY